MSKTTNIPQRCLGCHRVVGMPNTVNDKMKPVFVCPTCQDHSEPVLYATDGCEPCNKGDHDNCTYSQHCNCEYCYDEDMDDE